MAPLPLHATGFTTPLPDVVARDLGDGVPPPVGQPGNIKVTVDFLFYHLAVRSYLN